jgi:hypothetical protein
LNDVYKAVGRLWQLLYCFLASDGSGSNLRIFFALLDSDSDPHSQCDSGFGSRRPKSMWVQIRNTADSFCVGYFGLNGSGSTGLIESGSETLVVRLFSGVASIVPEP